MKLLFLSASAILAAIPGLYVIKSGVGTPPDQGILFGGIIEAFGATALILLWIYRKQIRRMSKKRLAKWVVVTSVLSFVLLCSYILLFTSTVIKVGSDTFYFPLWTSGDLKTMVERSGSRRATVTDYGPDAVYEKIDKMPDYALGVTTGTLLLVYQGVFTSLVVSFGLMGTYSKSGFIIKKPQ